MFALRRLAAPSLPRPARSAHLRAVCEPGKTAVAVEAMRARIALAVAAVEPDLDGASIATAVATVASNVRYAGWLDVALADGPEVLLGGSGAPRVVDRLVLALQTAGSTRVALPTCCRCGTTRWLTQRVDGLRACVACAGRARSEQCSRCGHDAPVSTRDDEGAAVCARCHQVDPETFEVCTQCARRRRIAYRTPDGRGLCSGCGRPHPVVACSMCGEIRPTISSGRRGRPKCSTCARTRATCSDCGMEDRPVAMVFASGPVCSTCHKKALSRKEVCKGCGQTRRIDPRDPQQRGLCSGCAGLDPWSVCSVCHTEERIYESGRCIGCTLHHRLRHLLGPSTVLEPLVDSLVGSDQPRSALRWLAKAETQALLGAMVRGEMAATHDALDEAAFTPARERLRQVLVAAGVLPDRHEPSARLEAWIDDQLDRVEMAEDRKVLDAFANWWVLQRYRRRIDRTGTASADYARGQVRGAIGFLAWLRGHGVSLSACSQGHVELWMAGPAARREARDFLRWACRRRLASDIRIVGRPDQVPARSESAGHYLALGRRFADDDTLPLVDRVAGLLLLCYGQNLVRQARLKTADVVVGRDGTSLRFGATEIYLVDPIARLVRDLSAHPQGRARTAAPSVSPWLFGGALPGRPISAEALGRRLQAYGIDAREARNSLLLDLGAELAPAFLADLLGMHPNTAVRWVRAAGGDWAGYAAARARA